MKITGATTWIVGNPWKNWLFVRLETDQDGLYGIGEGTINGFARNFNRSGSGILTVMVPAGSPNARVAANISGQVRHVLRRAGVPAAAIEHRAYAASGEEFNAPIRLAYNRMAAHAGPCGTWGDQAGRTSENRNYQNYGCATQQNLAAMVSNPLDLMYPADSQPPDAERRANVMAAYRTGSRTQTDYSGEPDSSIVRIGQ